MAYHENVLAAIGRTPLVRLQQGGGPRDATVLAKLEFLNPGGSIKDRMALHIIEKAEAGGCSSPAAPSSRTPSGNTGVGGGHGRGGEGLPLHLHDAGQDVEGEDQDALKAFGAQVVVTPTNVPADSPESYYSVAKRIAAETPNSFYLNQYHNPDNIEAHYQLDRRPRSGSRPAGRLDAFVAGMGTGGTMSGVRPLPQGEEPAHPERGRRPGRLASTTACSRPGSSPPRTSTRSRASART